MENSTLTNNTYNGSFTISDLNFLNSVESISKLAKEICDRFGYKIVKDISHKFEPIGITYVAILSESHIAIHTWPEKNELNIDISTCRNISPAEYKETIEQILSSHLKMNDLC